MANGAPTVSNGLVISGVTTTSDIKVGTGATLNVYGGATFSGIVTASSFSGDGSNITNLNASNIASGTVPTARLGSGTANSSTFLAGDSTIKTVTGTTINNNADNRVITGSGTANTLEGESNLTFDGTNLSVTGNVSLPDHVGPDYIGNIYIGNSNDFKLFHNASDNFIRSGTNTNIRIDNNSGVLGARFIPAGSSELYHNGSLRAYTAFNGFYAEQAEHNDDFDLLIANKYGSLGNNQRCALTCRVTKDAGGSHGGTNRQAVFGHMYNGSTGGGGYFNIRSNDGTNRDFYMDNNTNLRVNYGSNNIGSTNGTVVGSQGSDIRNKNLVGDGSVPYGLSEVLQLNPIRYQFKKELVNRIGFSAQQVEPIIPESVYDTGQDQDYEGNTVSGDTIKAMYYVDLIPVLVNAIKELKAENDALKKRLDDGGL